MSHDRTYKVVEVASYKLVDTAYKENVIEPSTYSCLQKNIIKTRACVIAPAHVMIAIDTSPVEYFPATNDPCPPLPRVTGHAQRSTESIVAVNN